MATIPLRSHDILDVDNPDPLPTPGDPLKPFKLTLIAMSLAVLTQARANEALMEKGHCVACHRVDEKLIGPAYNAVAAKYRSNKADALTYLLTKVREGGEGVWGDVPMPPNDTDKIDDADLKSLLEWILAL
jgi:cytochrome c